MGKRRVKVKRTRTLKVEFWCDKPFLDALDTAARWAQLTRSDYIRQKLLEDLRRQSLLPKEEL
jgi:hypothetical protein